MKKIKLITMMLFALLWGLSGKGQSGASCDSANFLIVGPYLNLPTQSQVLQKKWLKFEAESDTMDITLTGTNYLATDKVKKIKIYGGTCSSLTELGTDTVISSTDSVLTIHITGLTLGNLYYIKVYKNDSINTIAYNIKLDNINGDNPPCLNKAPLVTCDLVFNGGFEYYTPSGTLSATWDTTNELWLMSKTNWACPWNYNTSVSKPWGSPDLFSSNPPTGYTIDPFSNVGSNVWGYGQPVSSSPSGGLGYAGFFASIFDPIPSTYQMSEHFTQELRSPMLPGVTYNISMQVECSNFSGLATDHIGMYITSSNLLPTLTSYANSGGGVFEGDRGINLLASQINGSISGMSSNPGLITSDKGWVTISGQYTATGGEKYIIIGYFGSSFVNDDHGTGKDFNSNHTVLDQVSHVTFISVLQNMLVLSYPNNRKSYYYVDNISINPVVPTLSFTGPLTNCLKDNVYTISPFSDFLAGGYTYSISLSNLASSASAVNPSTGEFTVTWDPSAFATGSETITVTATNDVECSTTYSLTISSCCINRDGSPIFGSSGGTMDAINPSLGLISQATQLLPNSAAGGSIPGFATGSSVTTVSAKYFSINGTFTVDCDLHLIDCDVTLGDDAEIIVKPGITFTLDECHLYSCKPNMWKRIYLNDKHSEIIVNSTLIEDAKTAIETEKGAQYDIRGSVFNKNYIGLKVSEYNDDMTIDHSIESSIFTCRDFSSIIPSVSDNANPITAAYNTSGFPYASIAATYYTTLLEAPYASQRSYIGIQVTDIKNSTATSTTLPYDEIQFGDANSSGDVNIFDFLDYGIEAYNSTLNVYNNDFVNITNPDAAKMDCQIGTAVCSEGDNLFNIENTLYAGDATSGSAPGTHYKNKFSNCHTGIDAFQYMNASIWMNYFEWINGWGIRTEQDQDRTIVIAQNEINIAQKAISCFLNINANVTIFNNDIHAGSLYAAIGVDIDQVFTIPSFYDVNQNNITDVQSGVVANALYKAYIRTNDITLTHTATAVPDANGIYMTNGYGNLIDGNWIMGQNHDDSWEGGIRLEGGNTSNQILCNEMHTLGAGMLFSTSQVPIEIKRNLMDDNFWGLVLSGSVVGAQYTAPPYTPNDNMWSSSIFNAATYAFYSYGNLSPFYVRGTVLPYNPSILLLNLSYPPIYSTPVDFFISTGTLNLNCPQIMPGSGWGKKMELRQIANDTVRPGMDSSALYMNKQNLYRYLTNDTIDISTDTTLTAFMANSKLNNIGKIDSLERGSKSIINGSSNQLSALAAITNAINPTTDAETNSKAIYTMQINNALSGNGYDANQLNDLRALAVKCPYEAGTAVYMARSILKMYDTIHYYNDCEIVRPPQDKMRLIHKQPLAVSNMFKLYPNPNNGSMTLDYKLADSETGAIEIYDLAGKLISNHVFNSSSTTLQVNENNLDAGAYYYCIKVNGNKVKTDKLIIIK